MELMEHSRVCPTVSVIVLAYHHAPYIRQCLDSILMQKINFSMEILIGEDGSTDGTREIVLEYAEKYPEIIRAVVREENIGATKNLYDLFLRAKGMYIANCEGDDFWTDCNKLQQQVDFLESHPQFSACTHDCQIVNEGGVPCPVQKLNWVDSRSIFTMKNFQGIYLSGQPATLVHRNFFLDKGHDFSIIYTAHPLIADRTITLILLMYGKIYHEKKCMSCYRQFQSTTAKNATSQSFKNNPAVNQMQLELTRTLEQYVQNEFGCSVKFTRFKLEQWMKHCIKRAVLFRGRERKDIL